MNQKLRGHQQMKQVFNFKTTDLELMTCKSKMEAGIDGPGKEDITKPPDVEMLCGGSSFFIKTEIRRMSRVQAPDGKERLIPVETFHCERCGALLVDDNGQPMSRVLMSQ